MGSDVLEIADELYAVPLSDFTAQRDAVVKDLKSTDPATAAVVKGWRKPSLAAWVVNLLSRREGEQMDQLVSVGAALRAAQAGLDGAQLRELTRQRRQLTAAVTGRARALAADEGVRVTPAVADQVEATLTAAMLDETAARAVRSGLLTAALEVVGLEVDLTGRVAVEQALTGAHLASPTTPAPRPRPELHLVPDPDADRKAREAAEAELAQSMAERDQAATETEVQRDEVARLEARELQLAAKMEELRSEIAELEDVADELDEELSAAQQLLAESESELQSRQEAVRRAQTALDQLID